jgi:hypothetical protein
VPCGWAPHVAPAPHAAPAAGLMPPGSPPLGRHPLLGNGSALSIFLGGDAGGGMLLSAASTTLAAPSFFCAHAPARLRRQSRD